MASVSNLGSRVDLVLRQGSDFSTTLTFSNLDTTPVDLTGSTIVAAMRKTPRDQSANVTEFGVAITSPTTGVAVLTMSAAVTAKLVCSDSLTDPLSSYIWDLKITDPSGKVSAPLYGVVQISRQVATAT